MSYVSEYPDWDDPRPGHPPWSDPRSKPLDDVREVMDEMSYGRSYHRGRGVDVSGSVPLTPHLPDALVDSPPFIPECRHCGLVVFATNGGWVHADTFGYFCADGLHNAEVVALTDAQIVGSRADFGEAIARMVEAVAPLSEAFRVVAEHWGEAAKVIVKAFCTCRDSEIQKSEFCPVHGAEAATAVEVDPPVASRPKTKVDARKLMAVPKGHPAFLDDTIPEPFAGEQVWTHPQGGVIYVETDPFTHEPVRMRCFDVRGKVKKTSATPEKLAAGHGRWVRRPDLDA